MQLAYFSQEWSGHLKTILLKSGIRTDARTITNRSTAPPYRSAAAFAALFDHAHPILYRFGESVGAYVQGAWIVLEAPPDVRPGDVVEEVTAWNSDVSLRRLQWQTDEWVFRIFSGGGSEDHPGMVDRDEMIRIAESLTAQSR